MKLDLQTEFNNRAVRLKKQETRLKDLCNQTGLYYDSGRVQVFTQATENGIKNWGKSVSSKAVWGSKRNTLTNAAGQSIIQVKTSSLTGTPDSITQVVNKKGGIDRNYYDSNGRQYKQISNHNHGNAKNHPFGNNGEHAHDYICEPFQKK